MRQRLKGKGVSHGSVAGSVSAVHGTSRVGTEDYQGLSGCDDRSGEGVSGVAGSVDERSDSGSSSAVDRGATSGLEHDKRTLQRLSSILPQRPEVGSDSFHDSSPWTHTEAAHDLKSWGSRVADRGDQEPQTPGVTIDRLCVECRIGVVILATLLP